jgi:hypothetical protein
MGLGSAQITGTTHSLEPMSTSSTLVQARSKKGNIACIQASASNRQFHPHLNLRATTLRPRWWFFVGL